MPVMPGRSNLIKAPIVFSPVRRTFEAAHEKAVERGFH
jgi:hypothetical protein